MGHLSSHLKIISDSEPDESSGDNPVCHDNHACVGEMVQCMTHHALTAWAARPKETAGEESWRTRCTVEGCSTVVHEHQQDVCHAHREDRCCVCSDPADTINNYDEKKCFDCAGYKKVPCWVCKTPLRKEDASVFEKTIQIEHLSLHVVVCKRCYDLPVESGESEK